MHSAVVHQSMPVPHSSEISHLAERLECLVVNPVESLGESPDVVLVAEVLYIPDAVLDVEDLVENLDVDLGRRTET